MSKTLQILSFKNLLIGSLLISTSAVAQQKKPDSLKRNNLDEVVVTSLRKETKRKNVPQSMTIINKSAIDLTPSQEVTDLLKKNSSVSIIQYPGLSAGVGIRGKSIANVPDFTSTFGLEFNDLKGLDLRLNMRYTGKRTDTDFNDPKSPEVVYPEFLVADFGASYTFVKKHTLSLLMNNIGDENYYEKRGYNLAGRNYSVRYEIRF